MFKRIERWWWHRSSDTRQRLTRLCTIGGTLVFVALVNGWVYLARQEWVKDEPDTIVLNMIVLAFVAQLLLVSLVLSRLEGLHWFWKWFESLSAEFAGALILSALLLFLVTVPNQRRETNELKRGLIREMRSSDNGIALLAVEELAERGWLFDGTLQGAGLAGANLQGADLADADLRGATLVDANLQGADLANANLQRAFLIGANLQAILIGANLQGAFLVDADLQGASLVNADLQGALLGGASLQGADLLRADLRKALLWDAVFDETTMLPDGTRWTPDTDMARFTDPNHPEFWRSDDPRSPAYRGEGE
jgi:hypothetical protein